MIRLHVLSDIHTEFTDFVPPDVGADIIILAGDIGVGTKGLGWAGKHMAPGQAFAGKPVIYVPGNHELYGGDWDRTPGRLRKKALDLGIHYLDVGEKIIDDVRVLGCSLWTDFDLFGEGRRPEALAAAALYMVDYKQIKRDGRALLPEETRTLHLAQRAWLEEQLNEAPNGRWRKTVVVTHTLPSSASVAERYAKDLVSAAFASNLDHLVRKAELWIHGHTHDSFVYVLKTLQDDPGIDCRVVCNPRGYTQPGDHTQYEGKPLQENGRFDPGLVVEV